MESLSSAVCFVGQLRGQCDVSDFQVLTAPLSNATDVFVVVPEEDCSRASHLFLDFGLAVSVRCLSDSEAALSNAERHVLERGPEVWPGRRNVLHGLRYRNECLRFILEKGKGFEWIAYSRLDVIWRRFPSLESFRLLDDGATIWTMHTNLNLLLPGVHDKFAFGRTAAMHMYLSMLDWYVEPRNWWLFHKKQPIAHFWDHENQTRAPHIEVLVETYLRSRHVSARAHPGICLDVLWESARVGTECKKRPRLGHSSNRSLGGALMCEDSAPRSASGIWFPAGPQFKPEVYDYDGPFVGAVAAFLYAEQVRWGRPMNLLEAGCGTCALPWFLATTCLAARGFDGNRVALRKPSLLDHVLPPRDLTEIQNDECRFEVVLMGEDKGPNYDRIEELQNQCCLDGACTSILVFGDGRMESVSGWSRTSMLSKTPVAVYVKFPGASTEKVASDWVVSIDVADHIFSGNDADESLGHERLQAWVTNLHAWNRHGIIVSDTVGGHVQAILREPPFRGAYDRDLQAEARLKLFAGVHGSGRTLRWRHKLIVLRRRFPLTLPSCELSISGDGSGAEVYCVKGVTIGCVDASTLLLTGGCGGSIVRDGIESARVVCNGGIEHLQRFKSMTCNVNASILALLARSGFVVPSQKPVPVDACSKLELPVLTAWVDVPGSRYTSSFEQQKHELNSCLLWSSSTPRVLARHTSLIIVRLAPQFEKALSAEVSRVGQGSSGVLLMQFVCSDDPSVLAQAPVAICLPQPVSRIGGRTLKTSAGHPHGVECETSSVWWGQGTWDASLNGKYCDAFLQFEWQWYDGGFGHPLAHGKGSHIRGGRDGSLCQSMHSIYAFIYGELPMALWDRADTLVPVPSSIWRGCEWSAIYARTVRSALSGPHYTDPDGDFGPLEWAWLLARRPWAELDSESLGFLVWLLQALEARAWSHGTQSCRVSATQQGMMDQLPWKDVQACPNYFRALAESLPQHLACVGWKDGRCEAAPLDIEFKSGQQLGVRYRWSPWGTYAWRLAHRGLDWITKSAAG